MYETRNKRKKYVIGGLLLLVMFMVVGFASFSTNLQMNLSANPSNTEACKTTNWLFSSSQLTMSPYSNLYL